ncbi:hypothetical protein [Arthrobacter sp. MMS18-M83]|uniref:hypothetical protein n=1 Tax=Arthrobacter sp. MMS18-M83 TaxID=2996261 RepID=UPI00227CA380|nr:hypothetical protein [Arthrobacter sp. MMS18-M83]WAH97486.1 hypothetical protein OW521_00835 [Arthrobacter sp. MMS18-M83]
MMMSGTSDVAAVAGDSVSTVSNARNSTRKVKNETRERGDWGERHVRVFGGIEVLGSSLLVQLLVGNYVGLISRDRTIARGWLDMVSADGTTAWVWLDGGRGRRMVHAGDGIGLMVLEEASDVACTHETTNKNR